MSVFTLIISNQDREMDPSWTIRSVDVHHELNRIPFAELVLIDGNPAQRDFPLSNDTFFVPGEEIVISVRYENQPEQQAEIFKGIVVSHRIEADTVHSSLNVLLKHQAVRLTQGRKNQVFRSQTDKIVLETLFKEAEISPKVVDTPTSHPELVQYQSTNWDFALTRIEANGLHLALGPEESRIVDLSHTIEGANTHRLAYGLDPLLHMELELQGEDQTASVSSYAWDIANLKETSKATSKDYTVSQGDIKAEDLAEGVGSPILVQPSAAPLMLEELQAWSDASLKRSRLSRIRGTFSMVGDTKYRLLDTATIEGGSTRFVGEAPITGVRHRFSPAGWTTDVQLGLSAIPSANRFPIAATPANGLLPPIHGLQVGIVENIADDPDGNFRIQVRVPAWGEEAGPTWARMLSPDAGNGRGFTFWPEPGDEVALGFFNNDPRHAIVLGSMYSQSQPPADATGLPTTDNFLKGIFTRTGVQISFDDEKKQLKLSTSTEQSITLDEDGQLIELKDVHGNSLIMDQNGITLKSNKDLHFEASNNVTIQGTKVDIK